MKPQHTILIVDDDPINRTLLRAQIKSTGYRAITASSGAEALALLDGTIDLIVLDAMMPDTDGFELARFVRADIRFADLPLLMVTALESRDDRLRAVEAGVNDFLSKPVDRMELEIRVSALLKLRDAESERRRLASIVETSEDAILATDRDGIVIAWNPGAERLFGYSAEEVIGKSFLLLSPPDHYETSVRNKDQVCRGERLRSYDTVRLRRDGTLVDVSVTISPTRDATGTIDGISAIFRDITDRKRQERQIEEYSRALERQKHDLEQANRLLQEANERLAEMAITDGLTGLLNHRAFQDRLGQEMEKVARYGTPLSVLLLDIDRFKHYNDAYGHPAGDDVLKTIGKLLRGTARAGDIVARYGGEEFVVLMPHTDAEGACRFGERFRKAIEEYEWPRRTVTASFGAATTIGLGKTRDSLVADADQALYLAKSTGRNRVAHINDIGITGAAIPAG